MTNGIGWSVTGGVELLAWVGLEGVVLLAAAGVLALALRRAPASARHRVWFAAMVGLLALPLLEGVLPAWSVPVPGLFGEGVAPDVSRARLADRVPSEARAPQSAPGAKLFGPGVAGNASWRPPGKLERAGARARVSDPQAGDREGARSSAVGDENAEGVAFSGFPPVRGILLGIWASGAALLLAGLLWSLVSAARLGRRAKPFVEEPVTSLAKEVARELNLRRPLRVLRGGADTMPLTYGLLRPTLLLPRGAEDWSRRRLQAVLVHELAHVRRRDCLTQTLAEVARALHWLNPLAWLAVRRMRVEREYACDDAVLARGARGPEYANELLSLARAHRPAPVPRRAAVAMARPGTLGKRLRAVLDEERLRTLPRSLRWATTAAVLGLALPVAALSPTAAPDGHAGLEAEGPEDAGSVVGPEAAQEEVAQEATCGMAHEGWESSTHSRDADRARMVWSRPGCEVDVRIEGDLEFTADFRDVERIGPDGLLRIEEDGDGTERRVEVTPGAGGRPSYSYRIDGSERTFDGDARAWFREMLLQAFRRSGFMAEERVDALMETGGVEAVLRELDALHGDHPFAAYAGALVERSDLSEEETVAVLELARERVDSDHYMAQIVESFGDRRLESDRLFDAFLRASLGLESDHYRAQVLGHILERSDLGTVRVGGVLDASTEIESDHYRAGTLARALDRDPLSQAQVIEVTRAARSIESDHYKAEFLLDLLGRHRARGPLREAILEVMETIGSSHYRSSVAEAILGAEGR